MSFRLFLLLALLPAASLLRAQVPDTTAPAALANKAWAFHQAVGWDSSAHYYQQAAEGYYRLGRRTEAIDMWCRAARDRYNLGEYEVGFSLVEKARILVGDVPPQDSVSLVRIYRARGLYFLNTGRLDSAHLAYEAAYQLVQALPQTPLALQADVVEEHAVVLGHRGFREEEQALLRDALRLRQQCCAQSEPLAVTLSNLGFSFWQLGDYARATDYFAQALRHLEDIQSPNSYLIATIGNNLAYGYGQQERWDAQLEAYQGVLALYLDDLGEIHRDVAICYNNLGYTYGQMGRHVEQGRYYRKALAVRQQLLGPDHPDLAVSHQNLGFWYAENDQPAAAERSFHEALRIREQAFGPRHPEVARAHNSLALFYIGQRELQAALA
ncbi:MAG: tetratricopeptide repeat protein, partial [Bacteroidetes bacterium]